jgi:hypothetical protein
MCTAQAFYFAGNVEALEFYEEVHDADDPTMVTAWLIVAARGMSTLTYINCMTLDKETVSLNNADWDDHISFAVLSLVSNMAPDKGEAVGAAFRPVHLVVLSLERRITC